MEEVERFLKQSDRSPRSFPVDQSRWERLSNELRVRRRRKLLRAYVSRILLLFLLLLTLPGLVEYLQEQSAVPPPVTIGALPIPQNAPPATERSGKTPRAQDRAQLQQVQGRGIPVGNDPENPVMNSRSIRKKQEQTLCLSERSPIIGNEPSPLPQTLVNPETDKLRAYFPPVKNLEVQLGPYSIQPDTLQSPPLPSHLVPVTARARNRKWSVTFSTGLMRGITTLTPGRYQEEPDYPGQLVSKIINQTQLYLLDEKNTRQTELGRTLAVQLQCAISDRLAITAGVHHWDFNFRAGRQQDMPANDFYFQSIEQEQSHWLAEIGLRYRLPDLGRWTFQIGSYTLLTLDNKSRSQIIYWHQNAPIGQETRIENTPWQHSMRIRLDGQLYYRLHPNWQVGIGSGYLLDRPLLPYWDLRLGIQL